MDQSYIVCALGLLLVTACALTPIATPMPTAHPTPTALPSDTPRAKASRQMTETTTPDRVETSVAPVGNLSEAQEALLAYEPVMDPSPTVQAVLTDVARWFASGADLSQLETALDEATPHKSRPIRVSALDVTFLPRPSVPCDIIRSFFPRVLYIARL
jgi:hypothetical protein